MLRYFFFFQKQFIEELIDLFFFRFVIANDLSDAAAAAMRRNVELNGLGPFEDASADPATTAPKLNPGQVRVNEGDAW